MMEGSPWEPAGQVALQAASLGVSEPQSVMAPPGAGGMSLAWHAAGRKGCGAKCLSNQGADMGTSSVHAISSRLW